MLESLGQESPCVHAGDDVKSDREALVEYLGSIKIND
jgi:hypothetical protein